MGWVRVVSLGLCSVAAPALAQSSAGSPPQAAPTPADYQRALTLGDSYGKLSVDLPDDPVWQPDGNTLVYRKTSHGEHEFMVVDAASGTKRPAFDHARLASALSAAAHKPYKAGDLPFSHFDLLDQGSKIGFQEHPALARLRCFDETLPGFLP